MPRLVGDYLKKVPFWRRVAPLWLGAIINEAKLVIGALWAHETLYHVGGRGVDLAEKESLCVLGDEGRTRRAIRTSHRVGAWLV